jgi:hypothetical protein
MEMYPQDDLAAALAVEQSVWAQRVHAGLESTRRDLDEHAMTSDSEDAQAYGVLVRAFERAEEVLAAMPSKRP